MTGLRLAGTSGIPSYLSAQGKPVHRLFSGTFWSRLNGSIPALAIYTRT